MCGVSVEAGGEGGDFGGSGFVPESGGVADSVVGEGVESRGDAAGSEVAEGGSADEVVLVGVSGVEFGDVEGDFLLEFVLHVGGEVLAFSGEAVLGGVAGGGESAGGGGGALAEGAVESGREALGVGAGHGRCLLGWGRRSPGGLVDVGAGAGVARRDSSR